MINVLAFHSTESGKKNHNIPVVSMKNRNPSEKSERAMKADLNVLYISDILRGGGGSGRASCISGATFSHWQNSTTPLHADW
ncbi:hypothetical protein PUN28_015417 [Cardiocondyla obscurior]|uniref:Uncharacterized protein n=1 Tax=Cardiocondyla obscurior TaxID=286306 RepID=A0AAW2EVJ3_9HYME